MNHFRHIQELATSEPKKEICGFLLSPIDGSRYLEVWPTKNVTQKDPRNHFKIGEEDYLSLNSTGRLVGLYHSHPVDDHLFSPEDKDCAESLILPMLVYSLPSKRFNKYKPVKAVKDFDGRPFVVGWNDCAEIVYDWYLRNRNVRIPFFERTEQITEKGSANSTLVLYQSGFEPVSSQDLQEGDVLFFSIRTVGLNHVGIYLGQDQVVHQLMGKLSKVDRLSNGWNTHLRSVFRLKK